MFKLTLSNCFLCIFTFLHSGCMLLSSTMFGIRINELCGKESLSVYLLALRGRAGLFSRGSPLALSLKRAIGKPLGKDLMIHTIRTESILNSMLVPPRNKESLGNFWLNGAVLMG